MSRSQRLKACISAEGLTRVTGHTRAGDPSPPKEMASHVNEHKNIKTAFMFVQPFAHSYISHPFRGRHYALGDEEASLRVEKSPNSAEGERMGRRWTRLFSENLTRDPRELEESTLEREADKDTEGPCPRAAGSKWLAAVCKDILSSFVMESHQHTPTLSLRL
ncbi:unnamed protein product [Leuciscus chuanchicus]